jgi:glycosyltransferase involved in cell wall biosynthesis
MSDSQPFFSIVMPVHNRATLVGRALRSCLSQSFADFEVVVVDDGSSDASVEAVRDHDDPRIRVIVHERNLGRCPARNTAMAAARGEWFVFLDSDDELLPGALQTIHDDAVDAAADVVALRYSCIDDRGAVSPDPPYVDELWSYERFLRSLDDALLGTSETLPVSRASTFPEIAYPEGHAEEGLYHLDLARRGRTGVSAKITRRYNHDAPNQITRPDYRRALRFAADSARNADLVLARHGEAMQQHAATAYSFRLREAALYHFMAGHRGAGLRYARRAMRVGGWQPKLALVTALGLAGAVPLALSQAFQATLRRALRQKN